MMKKTLLDTLVKCLQDHDVVIDRRELQKSIDGEHGAAIEAWVHEYLGAETLLSKDELSLYSALQKSGDVEILEQSQDLSLVRGLSDQDLRTAIEDLRKSTATVEKQTEVLRIQQDTMSSLAKSNRQNLEARSTINRTQHRVWMTEYQTTSNEVEEMLQNLRSQITEIESQLKAIDADFHKTSSEVLKSDDKLLLSLQKLSSDLDSPQPKDDEVTRQVKDLCARLIKYTVEGIRYRLDKVYLEATNSLPLSPNDQSEDDSEITALRSELESLYSEIPPVAQISAEQQYLQPYLRALSAQRLQGKDRSQKALSYISSCLTFLISRLEALSTRIEERHSHRHATTLLLAAAHAELNTPSPPSPTKAKPSTAAPTSPTHRKKSHSKSSKPSSPVRPRTTTRRRSSTASFDDADPTTPAAQHLLQTLGISLPDPATELSATAHAMSTALADRTAKLALHARSVQESCEAAIATHVHDARATLALLRDSLLSETAFATVRLMDREVEEAVGHLEAEVERVRARLKGVDVAGLRERNVRRDELVERWGR